MHLFQSDGKEYSHHIPSHATLLSLSSVFIFHPQPYTILWIRIKGSVCQCLQRRSHQRVPFIPVIIQISPHKRHQIRHAKTFQLCQMNQQNEQPEQKSVKTSAADNPIKTNFNRRNAVAKSSFGIAKEHSAVNATRSLP